MLTSEFKFTSRELKFYVKLLEKTNVLNETYEMLNSEKSISVVKYIDEKGSIKRKWIVTSDCYLDDFYEFVWYIKSITSGGLYCGLDRIRKELILNLYKKYISDDK